MSERQAIEAIVAEAIGRVFNEYVQSHGLDAIAGAFATGVRVDVGDMLPSEAYERALSSVPEAWLKAFEVNASSNPAVRASCVEFVLAGLWATDQVSRTERHGRVSYEVPGS
jgi:magnesium chelatase subunit I